MSKRFGRNQKRKMREQIECLERSLDVSTVQISSLRYKLDNAETLCLQKFMDKSGMYERATKEMSYALGRRLGDELEPHAARLLNCSRQTLLSYNIRNDDVVMQREILTAEIPHLRINYVVI